MLHMWLTNDNIEFDTNVHESLLIQGIHYVKLGRFSLLILSCYSFDLIFYYVK